MLQLRAKGAIMGDALKAIARVEEGAVELAIVRDGKELASIQISAQVAADCAVLILRAAQVAFEKSGKPPPRVRDYTATPVTITPNSIRMAPATTLDGAGLLMYFGETVLGVTIPPMFLPSLGQELFALSARTDAPSQ